MRVTLGSTSARWSQPSSGRTRWYAVLRRDGCATAWPLPNHKRPDTLLDPHLPHWLSVRPCIDLADVGKRVDHRSRPLSAKTLARMERGFREYGGQWLMSYYGTGVGQSLDMPLRTITCTDRFALVTMRQRHAHLRMLTPEELKLAQGFPVRYVIDRYSDGTAVPKREQVRRIGNSVVPTMAMQLVRANARAA
ncbi:MAG: DNA cytosine methyltransferase [Atopobiaceae bacterium]|nr:DNA cytosine methyltransferase [Atopobiaceae bacterium]